MSMTHQQALLRQRVNEVLHYIWDPIGIAGYPGARDEYDTYEPVIVGLLLQGADEGAIADHLLEIERGPIGLEPSPAGARAAAAVLIRWRGWLSDATL